MQPQAIIDALEAQIHDRSRSRALARKSAGIPGFARSLFLRAAELLGADARRAAALARLAPDLIRGGGDPAWAYRLLGVSQRLAGRWKESAESFQTAGRAATDPIDRLAFQVGAVDSLARAGRVDDALALGKKLSRGLRRRRRPDLAARVELNMGNAALWSDRYGEAIRWYRGAMPDLNGGERAAVQLGLSTAELYGGHPQTSRELALEAQQAFYEINQQYSADLCGINLAHEAILRGRADEALAALTEIGERMGPEAETDRIRLLEFLGDAHLALNLFTEAEDAFQTALAQRSIRHTPLNYANCTYGLALARAGDGRWPEALRGFRRAQRLYARAGNVIWQSASQVDEAQALVQVGRKTAAANRLSPALRSLAAAGSPALNVRSRLLEVELREAEWIDRSKSLSRLLAQIRKLGLVGLEWKVHALRAAGVPSAQKPAHWRAMTRAIAESRLLIRSTLARSSYLQDKQEAISDYLSHLLRRGTAAHVEEAFGVVVQLRSAALIDELESARGVLTAEQTARLDALRGEVEAALGRGESGGPLRRAAVNEQKLASLRRRWTEASLQLREIGVGSGLPYNALVPTMVECSDELFVLSDSRAVRLGLSALGLKRSLRRLQFELFAPLTDTSAEAECAEAAIRELRGALLDPWYGGSGGAVLSPDGIGWSVPWQLLASQEPTVLLTPNLDPNSGRLCLRKPQRVVIWYHDAPDLPHIPQEVAAILNRYPTAEVCRSAWEARESVRRGHIDLLHVATHARIPKGNPMFSSLEFDDGKILAAELAQCGATFGLVVLSACETGTLSLKSRLEPDGLVRSFLARSAEGVIATQWLLDDRSAALGFDQFYRAMESGENVLSSLGSARASIRAVNPHPFFWGSFVFYGGYRKLKGQGA